MLQTVIGGRSLPLDRSSPDSLERAEVGSGMRGRVTRNGHGSYTDRNPLACRPWRQKEHEGETASLRGFATCHIPQSLPNPHDPTLPAIGQSTSGHKLAALCLRFVRTLACCACAFCVEAGLFDTSLWQRSLCHCHSGLVALLRQQRSSAPSWWVIPTNTLSSTKMSLWWLPLRSCRGTVSLQ